MEQVPRRETIKTLEDKSGSVGIASNKGGKRWVTFDVVSFTFAHIIAEA